MQKSHPGTGHNQILGRGEFLTGLSKENLAGEGKGIPTIVTKAKGKWKHTTLKPVSILYSMINPLSAINSPISNSLAQDPSHLPPMPSLQVSWAMMFLTPHSAVTAPDAVAPSSSSPLSTGSTSGLPVPSRGCLGALGLFGNLCPSLGPLPQKDQLDDVSSLPGRTARQLPSSGAVGKPGHLFSPVLAALKPW